MKRFTLKEFLVESNRIEGITRTPDMLEDEDTMAEIFLSKAKLTIEDLVDIVDTFAGPDARIRNQHGQNVRVGSHEPIKGGPGVVHALSELLDTVNRHKEHPGAKSAHWIHVQYESLHPFLDGNGRSGRLLWLWCMGGIDKAPLGFLHTFYYQTLDASDGRG
jgi:hypothetical protein